MQAVSAIGSSYIVQVFGSDKIEVGPSFGSGSRSGGRVRVGYGRYERYDALSAASRRAFHIEDHGTSKEACM